METTSNGCWSSTRTWQDNAQEFAELDSGEGWPFAALVACSVVRAPAGVRRGSDRDRDQNGKVNATVFAEVAGTSADRVLRYLDAWQRAAADGAGSLRVQYIGIDACRARFT